MANLNIEMISYLLGGSFGLFLCIQYVMFYIILSRKQESKKDKKDLIYIAVVGLAVAVYGIFGALSAGFETLSISVIFYRLKLVAAIIMVIGYVRLLRYITLFIKDLGFVETDGYKETTKIYTIVIYSIAAALSGLTVFTNLIIDKATGQYRITSLIFLFYLITITVIEFIEFIRIMRNEKGKITHLNGIRFKTIMWAGIVTVLIGGSEVILRTVVGNEFFCQIGSIFMWTIIGISIALSLNLMFEYMEVLARMSESNKKLSDLNKKIMDEVRLAQSLQISLLPIDKQREIQKYLDMEISYMPMQSVGGDYYDFYMLGHNKVLVLLGDASGHGVYAAMIWAMLKVEVEELIEEKSFNDIADAFTLLNKRITRILENTYSYATLFSCVVDMNEHTVTYISAGHSDQIYYSSRTKTTFKIKNKNPIIGTFKNAKYYAETITYQSGDAIMLFTDGINESVNREGKQLGFDQMEFMLAKSCNENEEASSVLNMMLSEVEEYCEGVMQQDDRTVLVIRL